MALWGASQEDHSPDLAGGGAVGCHGGQLHFLPGQMLGLVPARRCTAISLVSRFRSSQELSAGSESELRNQRDTRIINLLV